MVAFEQFAFTSGEWSESASSRIGLENRARACKRLLNFFVEPTGAASNRAGSKFISEVKDSTKKTRLIPFEYGDNDTYQLEFGDQYARIIRNGAQVFHPADAITGITQANPAVVTATAHGLSNGDTVYIEDVGGMVELNGRFFTVANALTNTFELSGEDSTAHTAYTSGGNALQLAEFSTPYLEADLFNVRFTQTNNVMTMTHPDYQAREITRTQHYAWTMSTITFAPDISEPAGGSVTPTTAGSDTIKYAVVGISDNTGELSLPHEFETSTGTLPVDGTNKNSLTWTNDTDASEYNVYRAKNGVYGFIGVARWDGSGTVDFEDDGIEPDFADTPPKSYDPISASDKYPLAVGFYGSRRIFGGSNDNPVTLYTTQTNNLYNMNKSSPLLATDSIEISILANQVNAIRHIVPLAELIVLTTSTVRKVVEKDGLLSAEDLPELKFQSGYGASDVPPLLIGTNALFIQKGGYTVRDLGYSFESDAYSGDDLNVLSKHRENRLKIVDWCWAEVPHGIVWCVLDDGTLASMTYLPEYNVVAWHSHDMSAGFVESISSVNEGDETAVYMVVKRTVDGSEKRYIERLQTRLFTDVADAYHVDCGLTYDGYKSASLTLSSASVGTGVTATASISTFSSSDVGKRIVSGDGVAEITGYTSATVVTVSVTTAFSSTAIASDGWAVAVNQFSGLDHLEGEQVKTFGDANVFPLKTVSSGSITLSQYVAKAHVGLPYECIAEPMNIEFVGQSGSSSGKEKNINGMVIRVKNSRGFFAGQTEDNLIEWKQASESNYISMPAFTGKVEIPVMGEWDLNGSFMVKVSDPVPVTILSILAEASFG